MADELTSRQLTGLYEAARKFKKARDKEVGRQVSARTGKFIGGWRGEDLAALNRKWNLAGPDKTYIQSLYTQMTDLAADAAKIDADKALKAGDLAKKQADMYNNLYLLLKAGITAEGSSAGRQGAARISAKAKLQDEILKAEHNKLVEMTGVAESAKPKVEQSINKALGAATGKDGTLDTLDELESNITFWETMNNELSRLSSPGQRQSLMRSVEASLGGSPEGETQVLSARARKARGVAAKQFLTLSAKAQSDIDQANEKYTQKVKPMIATFTKELGGQRPQFARTVTEISNAVGNLGKFKDAEAALKKAYERLDPPDGSKSPFQKEQERLAALVEQEQDTTGPIEKARQELWGTRDFSTYASNLFNRDYADLSREDKNTAIRRLLKDRRRGRRGGRAARRDALRSGDPTRRTEPGAEEAATAQEPPTSESQNASASAAQPPAVTDQAPETEDVVDYDSVQGLHNKLPAEFRISGSTEDDFKLEVLQDGEVVKSLTVADPEIDEYLAAYETFEKEGLSPEAGISAEEAADKAFSEQEDLALTGETHAQEMDLPDDPLTEDDAFSAAAQAAAQALTAGAAPSAAGAPLAADPIMSAPPGGIAPKEEGGFDIQADIERRIQTNLLRSQMAEAQNQALEAGGASPEEIQALNVPGDEAATSAARTAEILRRRMQQQAIDAGVGR